MKCRNVLRLLNRYADGECANRVEVFRIEEHLAGCAECGKRLEEIRALRRTLASVERIRTTRVPVDEIMDRHSAKAGPVRRFDLLPMAAAAAAVILLAGSLRMLSVESDASIVQYLYRSMSEAEVAYLAAGETAYTFDYSGK